MPRLRVLWVFLLAGSVSHALAFVPGSTPLVSASSFSQNFGQFSPDTTYLDSSKSGVSPFSNPGDSTSEARQKRFVDSLRHADSLNALRQQGGEDSLEFPLDSLKAATDSLAKKDSTWVVYLDSTARVEQFVHRRYDSPTADLFPRDDYSLYLDVKSPAYKREFQIDSASQSVTVREQVNGLDVKVPLTVSLDDYITLRRDSERKSSWGKIVKDYRFTETKEELGGVLNNLKNIEIPIPANPLFNIFGGRGIKLNVSGAVDIRAAFRNSKSDAATTSRFDQSSNEPDFNQDVQILVDGLIGDKLKIRADWNTQRTFEYENQLKINYTGYDDEIIQSVEAGNVSLQTPWLIGGSQALFGIKAKLQTGPLTLTTLVSQKKGQARELTVSGGAQSSGPQDIYPDGYSKNYYFVDTVYRQYWDTLHSSPVPPVTADIQAHRILQIDVWKTVVPTSQNATIAILQKAYVDLPPHLFDESYQPGFTNLLDSSSSGRYKQAYWIRLDPSKDYKFDKDGGYIVFNSLEDQQAYAVSYTVQGYPDPFHQGKFLSMVYGDSIPGRNDPYLKLIKPIDLGNHPEYKPAWDLMLKNIYPIGGRNVDEKDFEFKIARRTDGPEAFQLFNKDLLTIMGLDRFDNTNAPRPDGQFDFIRGLTIDVERGEVIFPSLRPFDQGIIEYFRRNNLPTDGLDTVLFREVYDTTAYAARQLAIKNKYVMHVKATAAAAGGQNGPIKLGFNVVEGSVQVLMDGRTLTPNVDYSVDYIVGEVKITNPLALVPGANVQVKYEQNDLFQLASKTLIGARGEMPNFLPNTNLGFTFMNLNQATLSDKVRLGEEPTNNSIIGADISTTLDLPFLTDALDALPFIRTREGSSIHFGGEAAYMIPDPNTKRSSIQSDNNVGVAYLDDFEGARRTIPLSLPYTGWHLASAPVYTFLGNIPDSEKTYYKARLNWYNNSTCFQPVLVTEIFGNRKQVRRGQEFVTVLGFHYDPDHRGTYNFSPNLDSTLYHRRHGTDEDRRKNWGGAMRFISNSVGLLEQNAEYLEIWLKASSDDIDDLRRGRLYIDIGKISEDAIPDGQRNSEDYIPFPENPRGNPTGVIHPGQDLGLDMIPDEQERSVHANFLQNNPRQNIPPGVEYDKDVDVDDPAGDDWDFETCSPDITHANGTEGNKQNRFGRQSPVGQFPDTEDLNSNGVTDTDNQYLEYEVPLDSLVVDSLNRVGHNPYIVGRGDNGWYQIRLPLRGATRTIPANRSQEDLLRSVEYMRLWFTGFKDSVNVKIAEMNFVGSQWSQRIQNDSIMKPSVVSIEDNPEYNSDDYRALGIVRERDKTQPDQVIEGNEQSMSLILNGLVRGDSREVYRSFTVRPLDLFNYKAMKMFVHGDTRFNYYAPDRYDAEVFIRFGSDSANYYEYRTPVKPGWHPDNQITINFAELTSIKAARDSANQIYRVAANNKGASYGIKGNPSLRQVREISIGVTNPSAQGGTRPLIGQVWVNELRLTDVDNAKGLAYHFDSQIKLADFGSVQFSYAQTDPSFHALDQRFGSQNTSVNWAISSSVSLDKYFPQEWQGTSVNFGYSHSENLVKPKYLPNTDVVVQVAASRVAERPDPNAQALADDLVTSSQTLQVRDSYSLSNFRISLPTQWWLVRDTFSKLAFGFQYSLAQDRDPSIAERRSWVWNFKVSYGVSISSDYFLQPFKNIFKGIFLLDQFKDWKLYYVPFTNFSGNLGAQRSRTFEQTRFAGSQPRDTRSFTAGKQAGFGWKLTEGGLLNLSGDYGLSLDRNLYNIDNDTVGRNFSSILKNMLFSGADNQYSQRMTINSKPRILDILGLTKYLDLNAGYTVTYNWRNTFQPEDRGKSAGFDNSITLGTNFKLKSLTDPWFASGDDASRPQLTPVNRPKGGGGPGQTKDSSGAQLVEPDTGKRKGPDVFGGLKTLARIFIKIPLLDYESISINFSQSNRVANGGVIGSAGFQNFWGRLPFQGSLPEYGPSRLYQLGLSSDPSGRLEYAPTSSFPFIGWRTIPGRRAPNIQSADQFAQSNSIGLRTNRPLWEGATLEVNWKVGWQFSKSTTITTLDDGMPIPGVVTVGGSVERSFLTLPPVLFLKVFKSNLEDVGKKFDQYSASKPANEALVEAFEKGMEAMPFLNKVFGQYVPRPNWTMRWDGIEKIYGLKSVFTKLSLEHSYSSSFHRDFRGDFLTGSERTDVERVSYGFSPLAAVNASFKEFLKGGLSGSLRYNTSTILDLNAASLNIVETLSQEMALTLSYSRKGFKFPIFGLNLSNDVDLTVTFSRTKNSRRSHDPHTLSQNQEGVPLEGNTRTLLEPRIRYDLSSRVRASLFYRLSKLAPDEGGSATIGTTTNEAGLDIHITI
ncbi:MAG: cell surface protein SprA [Ignavibacteriae bacterium]|nr:cell surface protein SprA [Ignavibacteriota bacterium]